MNDEIVNSASKIIGFSPLELVLMGAVTTVVTVFWRFILRQSKESTDAINNNTSALRELKDEFGRKIKKVNKI